MGTRCLQVEGRTLFECVSTGRVLSTKMSVRRDMGEYEQEFRSDCNSLHESVSASYPTEAANRNLVSHPLKNLFLPKSANNLCC